MGLRIYCVLRVLAKKQVVAEEREWLEGLFSHKGLVKVQRHHEAPGAHVRRVKVHEFLEKVLVTSSEVL